VACLNNVPAYFSTEQRKEFIPFSAAILYDLHYLFHLGSTRIKYDAQEMVTCRV